MENLPACPVCGLENTYQDGDNYICPDCGHEWPDEDVAANSDDSDANKPIVDANGNPLADGDAVILIKDLKVKGSSTVLKKGTKVKSIRLVPGGSDGHDVDCKLDAGSFTLKSIYLKKA
ncbi:MAG TPA: zinc ribbon domain-containing protein YjdM [Burkholderiaceae bacterium]|nr:zinc ribbon domain-containing protein YjdM [Burkholderiaceae bacterium]